MNRAGRITRGPFRRSWTVALFLPLLLAAAPPSYSQAVECSGFPKTYLLRSEPVQVNPGARCRPSILFGVQRPGFANYALPTIPENFCLYVRRAGRTESIGPICNQRKGVIGLPGDLEYLWSAGDLVRAVVTLKPKGRN